MNIHDIWGDNPDLDTFVKDLKKLYNGGYEKMVEDFLMYAIKAITSEKGTTAVANLLYCNSDYSEKDVLVIFRDHDGMEIAGHIPEDCEFIIKQKA